MSDTLPNITIQPDTVTDLYAEQVLIDAGVVIGDIIEVTLFGNGTARLYSGPTPPTTIDNETGYDYLDVKESQTNEADDTGAYIYSKLGCIIAVRAG